MVIVASIIFSALLAVSSTFYLSIVETEWVYAQCYVSRVTWKPDLYDIYLSNVTNPVFVDSNRSSTNVNSTANDTLPLHPTKLQVKGWFYLVNVKYKNMYFHGAIRDPSETEMIPPIYEEKRVYECLCMIEKLRSEIAFQKNTYEKYVAYMKKKQEEEGKSIDDYVGANYNEDDYIFFVVATMWPKIDAFSENHDIEKTIKITLVTASLAMLLVSIVMLKVFYSYYVKDGESEYAQVVRA